MARKVVTTLVDDIDGESEAVETISFSLNGKFFEIDLDETHAVALRESFDEFIPFARAVNPPGGKKTKAVGERLDRETASAIRGWAQGHGHDVADRGRIPHNVVEAYQARQLIDA